MASRTGGGGSSRRAVEYFPRRFLRLVQRAFVPPLFQALRQAVAEEVLAAFLADVQQLPAGPRTIHG